MPDWFYIRILTIIKEMRQWIKKIWKKIGEWRHMVSGRVYFKGRSRGERHRNITLLKINIESVLKNKVIMHI